VRTPKEAAERIIDGYREVCRMTTPHAECDPSKSSDNAVMVAVAYTTAEATIKQLTDERDVAKREAEQLRRLGNKQRDEIENLNYMADAVERLRDIGRATGCDHVDSEDGR